MAALSEYDAWKAEREAVLAAKAFPRPNWRAWVKALPNDWKSWALVALCALVVLAAIRLGGV